MPVNQAQVLIQIYFKSKNCNLFNSKKVDLSYEQTKINEQIKDMFKKEFYPDLMKTDNDFDRMENGKIALWVKSFKGSLCENYLNENVK